MIVGITGTSLAFERLVRALAEYAASHPDDRVWVQHGQVPLPPGLEGAPTLPRAELLAKAQQADAIVCHAGSGSVLDAMKLGHVPIVMPRRRHLGEHVMNNHQLELAEALQAQGRVLVVHEAAELVEAIASAKRLRRSPTTDVPCQLRDSMREDVRALPVGRRAQATWSALRALTSWIPVHLVVGKHT